MKHFNTEPTAQLPGKGKARMSRESKETLELISDAFIIYAASDKPFFHKITGRCFPLMGFKHYCAKHYGQVEMLEEDKDGNVTEKRVNAGELWANPDFPVISRRVVRDVVMEPTLESEADGDPETYNRWHVLKLEMVEPNVTATADDIGIFLAHLMYISDSDQVGVMFFLCWLAQLYQTPGIKMPTAILFYSKFGGVGKTMLWKLLKEVFGRSMVGSCTGANLNKSFDDVIENKRLLVVNEMARSDKADGYEKFKNMISEEQVSFEGKGRAARDIANITHYIVTTNNGDALPLMEKDRRVLVLACMAERKDDAYYRELAAWMEGPGPAALANVLANWKFPADWDPCAPVPETAASHAMQQAGKGDLRLLVEDLIERRLDPFHRDFSPVGDLCVSLNGSAGRRGQLSKPVTLTSLGTVLKAICGEQVQFRVKRKGDDSRPLRVALWRNAEQWEDATPEHRGEHLDSPEAPRVFAVQGGTDHGRA